MAAPSEIRHLARAHGLGGDAAGLLAALAQALAAEPDPPTAIRDPRDVVDRHLADSLEGLAVGGLREARTVADLGSGAGFPGLPLAVALQSARFDLLEAQRRKCEAITRLAAAAGLSNARAVPVRAEDWAAGEGRERYDAVTARAVAPLAVLVEYAAPLLRDGGVLIAWKGQPDPEEEAGGRRAAERAGLATQPALPSEPFPGARRKLYVYSKVKPTPDFLPRRAGVAARRPLV